MAEKTTTGKLVAAIGGLVLIISLFLSWVGFSVPDIGSELNDPTGQLGQAINQLPNVAETSKSQNAFGLLGFMPFLFLLIGAIAIVPAALDIFDLQVELPIDNALISIAGGSIAVGGVLVILDGPGSKIGVWLALVGAIAITVGGFMDSDEGESYAYDGFAQAPPQQAQMPPQAQPPAPQQPPTPQQPPQNPPPPTQL